MNKKLLPSCPYCGHTPNYLDAWVLKNKGEYNCSKCGRVSDIKYSDSIYKKFLITMAIGVVITILSLVININLPVLEVLALIIPFLIFYSRVPYMMYFSEARQRDDMYKSNK